MKTWWVSDYLQKGEWWIVAAIAVWVIGSIVLHELAHGWMALRCGDQTPRMTGHMTWNPLVHMGGMSLLMFALVGIAWGQMPVNPANFRGRHDDAKVAAAGPGMNLIICCAAIIATVLWVGFAGGRWLAWAASDEVFLRGLVALQLGVTMNIALALLNMIPVPPLDGSRIVASFVPGLREMMMGRKSNPVAMIIVLALFFGGGRFIFQAAQYASDAATFTAVRTVFPNPPARKP